MNEFEEIMVWLVYVITLIGLKKGTKEPLMWISYQWSRVRRLP